MTRFLSSFLVVFALILAGCEATQYVNRGDSDLAAGRPTQALANYKRALQKDPKLREQPDFQAKLLEANWQSSFAEAQSFEAQLGWEQAIAKYEETLRYKPGHPPAIQGIARAKVRGSDSRYESALDDANNGQLDKAAGNLRKALALNPNNASALGALASIEGGAPPASAQAFVSAQTLSTNRQWQQAASAYNTIIRNDRNHLPSRAARYEANQKLSQSKNLASTAAKQFDGKRLDQAITSATQSLDIWPNNRPAQRTFERAKAQRDEAEALFTQAKQQLGNQQWDAAIASVGQTRQVYPYHPGINGFEQKVRQEAVDTYVREGNRLLAAGELEAASHTFRAAFKYDRNSDAAKRGLAEVAFAHGQGAENDGLPGNAMLWYLDANRQRPKDQKYQQALDRVRAAINAKAAIQLAAVVTDSNQKTNDDTKALQDEINAQIVAGKPAFVHLVDGNAKPNPKNPLFKAMVTLNRIQTQQRLVSSTKQVHVYTDYRNVPNPKIPYLEAELRSAERDLARARINRIRHICRSCSGRGHTHCNSCGGKGKGHCSACRGAGKKKVGDKHTSCRVCGGHGHSTCNTCRGRGNFPCGKCGGKGHYFAIDTRAIHRAQSRVRDAAHRLDCEPRLVRESFRAHWPYTLEVHAMTGEASSVANIVDVAANNKVINSLSVNPIFNVSDKLVLNANPSVGLREDRLVLPSNAVAYRTLVQSMAKKTAPALIEAAAVERANAFIREANAQARAGRADLDLEARMTAMVILESIRPKEAQKILSDIHNPK